MVPHSKSIVLKTHYCAGIFVLAFKNEFRET
jgi:hypothetical protein